MRSGRRPVPEEGRSLPAALTTDALLRHAELTRFRRRKPPTPLTPCEGRPRLIPGSRHKNPEKNIS